MAGCQSVKMKLLLHHGAKIILFFLLCSSVTCQDDENVLEMEVVAQKCKSADHCRERYSREGGCEYSNTTLVLGCGPCLPNHSPRSADDTCKQDTVCNAASIPRKDNAQSMNVTNSTEFTAETHLTYLCYDGVWPLILRRSILLTIYCNHYGEWEWKQLYWAGMPCLEEAPWNHICVIVPVAGVVLVAVLVCFCCREQCKKLARRCHTQLCACNSRTSHHPEDKHGPSNPLLPCNSHTSHHPEDERGPSNVVLPDMRQYYNHEPLVVTPQVLHTEIVVANSDRKLMTSA